MHGERDHVQPGYRLGDAETCPRRSSSAWALHLKDDPGEPRPRQDV